MTEYIKRGEKLIYPERIEEWKEYVESKMHNGIADFDLRCALELMECLENGYTLEEVKKVLKGQDHTGYTAMFVKNVVFTFSKKGPEFFEYTTNGKISSKTKSQIEDKKRENQQLEELHKKDKAERIQEESEISQKLKEKRQLVQEVREIDESQKEHKRKQGLSDNKKDVERD